jgi:hypothetical protein
MGVVPSFCVESAERELTERGLSSAVEILTSLCGASRMKLPIGKMPKRQRTSARSPSSTRPTDNEQSRTCCVDIMSRWRNGTFAQALKRWVVSGPVTGPRTPR